MVVTPDSTSHSRPNIGWETEELFLLGDQYFDAVEQAIRSARKSVDLEMYLFATDEIGLRFIDSLIGASSRGIEVRVILDGIGSLGWYGAIADKLEAAGIRVKIYHPLPAAAWFIKHHHRDRRQSFWSLLSRVNRRTHRKLIIIDGVRAFVGSRNLIKVHSEALMGELAWSDVSVAVSGAGLPDLQLAFDRTWRGRGIIFRSLPKLKRVQQSAAELVRLNISRRVRRWHNRNLLMRLNAATRRIWIATGYFVPTRSLLRVLAQAAKKGVEVRILVPSKSDVFFYPFVGAAFQYELMRAGAVIMEYLPSVLHSKAMIIDNYAIVGSSNINHRSLLHDLEVDVVLSSADFVDQLERRFSDDFKQARCLDVYKNSYTLWQRLVGRIALVFKRYI